MLYLVSAAACCNGVAMGVCFAMYNMHTYIHTYMHSLTHTTHTHTHTHQHTQTHSDTQTAKPRHKHTLTYSQYSRSSPHSHIHSRKHTHTLSLIPFYKLANNGLICSCIHNKTVHQQTWPSPEMCTMCASLSR